MPRQQPQRTAPLGQSLGHTSNPRHHDALVDFRARRLQRRLDDLERTNPTDIPAASFVPSTTDHSHPSTSTLTPTFTPNTGTTTKKKPSGNVRRILYARKTIKDWLEELPSDPRPPYLDAVAPVPKTPPRNLCSSCGYVGAYKCPKCAEMSCGRECMEVHERDGGCGVGG